MPNGAVIPITKNLSTPEAIDRGYRTLTASLASPESHRFVSNQIDSSSEGPEAA